MSSPTPPPATPSAAPSPWTLYALGAVFLGLIVAYWQPLRYHWDLATGSDLYSHTLLLPLIVAGLFCDNRNRPSPSAPQPLYALLPGILGALSLFYFFQIDANPADAKQVENYLAPAMSSLAFFSMAALCLFLGRDTVKINRFPIALLILIAPFSVEIRVHIETFFQHASAEVAYWFIKWSGITIRREGLLFDMPAIDMLVAPQCSGIRSTLVLFIVSLVGAYLFLKTRSRQLIAALLFIPLGILRNGFRILLLAILCDRYGPEMIDGWVHKSGGTPLFVVTLVPLFILIYLLRRSEQKREKPTKATS